MARGTEGTWSTGYSCQYRCTVDDGARAEGEGEIGPGLGPALPYHHVPWAFEEYENSFLSSLFSILAMIYYYRDGALTRHTYRGQRQHSGVSSLLTPLCEF